MAVKSILPGESFSCFFSNLCNISELQHMVSLVDLEKISDAFASLHLDYCNALFSDLGKFSLMSFESNKAREL